MRPLRVGVVQNNPAFLEREANLARCFKMMSGKRADLWVLPEFFATGYAFESAEQAHAASEPVPAGPTCRALLSYARKRRCAIIAGLPERAGKKYYNTAVFVSPDGVRKYRKTHLFGRETLFFSPGDTGFRIFKWRGVKIGVMVCFDWVFPEACRTLSLKGAQLVALPSNLVLPWGSYVMRTRSVENRVFTVVANRCGREGKLHYIGMSQVAAPDGTVLFRAPGGKQFCRVASVDPQEALDKRLTRYNSLFGDRRPEYYKL